MCRYPQGFVGVLGPEPYSSDTSPERDKTLSGTTLLRTFRFPPPPRGRSEEESETDPVKKGGGPLFSETFGSRTSSLLKCGTDQRRLILILGSREWVDFFFRTLYLPPVFFFELPFVYDNLVRYRFGGSMDLQRLGHGKEHQILENVSRINVGEEY